MGYAAAKRYVSGVAWAEFVSAWKRPAQRHFPAYAIVAHKHGVGQGKDFETPLQQALRGFTVTAHYRPTFDWLLQTG